MKQSGQFTFDFNKKPTQTRKQQLLTTMEQLLPWTDWLARIAAKLAVTDNTQPSAVEPLLRIFLMQQWFGYSDRAMEEALYDTPLLCGFAKLNANEDDIPDETTLRNFRHALERHGLAENVLHDTHAYLAEQGLSFNKGSIVDASLIVEPVPIKHPQHFRDDAPSSPQKSNDNRIEMNADIGAHAYDVGGAVQYALHNTPMQATQERFMAEKSRAEPFAQELSKQQYALNQHAIVAMTDGRGRITYVNDKFCAVSGYSREELIGRDHCILNSGHHPKGFFQNMYHTVLRGESWHAEVCNRSKSGALYWLDTTIVAFMDYQGKPEQFVSIRTEISSLKLAQQKIIEQHEELTATVRAIPDLLFEMDSDGLFLKVRNPNPELMSIQQEQFLGKTAREVLPAEAAEQMLQALHIAADKGFCQSTEIQLNFGDSQKWFELYVAKMAYTSGKPRFVIISRDISDRKEKEQKLLDTYVELTENAQQLLVAKKAAEHANLSKSEFLTNMSHELRTPMHAILSFADLGRKKIKSATPDKLEAYFQRIQQSGDNLLTLLNELLDLAKLESGKMELNPKIHNLQQLVADAMAELAILAQDKGLQIELITDGDDLLANVDATRYSQVIRNILGNAIKFTPAGGHVGIRLFRCKLAEEDAFTLEVTDSGVGIPAEELATIFDKFVQSSKTKTGAGGTGLGLAICKEIVEAHGGMITANNSLTGGAVFTITVPVK